MLIIQPAEETGVGAAAMLAAGVFAADRLPRCVLALHDHPTIPVGKVGSCPGYSSANVDGFRLTVKGLGGHGAYPHTAVDPVSLAARIVLGLNDLVARQIDVHTPVVITVGSIHGGTKNNVIPGEVVIEATVRTHDGETRLLIPEKVEQMAIGLAAAVGAPEPVLEYDFGTPAGYNHPDLVAQARAVFARELGAENEILYPPGMGGEDFSRYGKVVPGFQFRLGEGRPERVMSLHSGDFDPPEESIAIGMRVVAAIIWDQLLRPRDGTDLAPIPEAHLTGILGEELGGQQVE